jgi:hypothetical protein
MSGLSQHRWIQLLYFLLLVQLRPVILSVLPQKKLSERHKTLLEILCKEFYVCSSPESYLGMAIPEKASAKTSVSKMVPVGASNLGYCT